MDLFLHKGIYLSCVGLLSLLVGSFLNVVIYRLPLMMRRNWVYECKELLGLEPESVESEPLNLFTPRSHCPHCKHKITVFENIPLLSYFFLKGKCLHCKKPITVRYLLVEMASAVLSVIIAWYFGISWQTFAALLFTWGLLVLACIDLEQQLLPDVIVLALLWLGLLVNLGGWFSDCQSVIIGASVGYLSLWVLGRIFYLITGKIGMGHGDFKLLAMLGAWLGWQWLPIIVFVASLLGTLVGVSLIIFKQRNREMPIPFGPYLALAGWLALLCGKQWPVLNWQFVF